ncbi:Probable polyketide synthase [Mycobacteroides abscessus subsp. abscessus]|nr:Probable polyketide synthase [Mycobacteroides abscessus subsp. abscessus]
MLDMRHFDKNVSYHSLDLDRMLARRRAETVALLRGVNAKLADGVYRPLPYELYGTADVAKAFEEVARSTRIGSPAATALSAWRSAGGWCARAPPGSPCSAVAARAARRRAGSWRSGRRWAWR